MYKLAIQTFNMKLGYYSYDVATKNLTIDTNPFSKRHPLEVQNRDRGTCHLYLEKQSFSISRGALALSFAGLVASSLAFALALFRLG